MKIGIPLGGEVEDANKPVDRETLYNEVWTEPVSVVAPRYGLSDVGLAKICRALSIPLPSRGYWAKVKAGRTMGRVALPELKQPSPVRTSLKKLPLEKVAAREVARKAAEDARMQLPPIPPSEVSSSPLHPLVLAASKRLRRRDGWPENTLIRDAPKEVLHLSVTRTALDRALAITDALLKTLSSRGFDVEIDGERGATLLQWLETGTTLEFILTEHVQRARHEVTPAEERARRRYWDRQRWDSSAQPPSIPIYDYSATGLLTVQVGRWPSRSWRDTQKTKLEQRLGELTAGVMMLAQETHAKEQEEARRKEARNRAVAHYEFLTKRRADELERFKELEVSATNWERASRLRAFADAMEARANQAGELSTPKIAWLEWARSKADWLDPLILVSDLILDAPEPKHPGYW